MKGQLSLAVVGTEVFTPDVAGPGNFAAYLSSLNLVAGDIITVKKYMDIDLEGSPEVASETVIAYEDVVAAGDTLLELVPFTLEASQVGRVGVTITAQTTALPRNVGYRLTNVATGA